MPDTLINRLASRGLAPAATNGVRERAAKRQQDEGRQSESLLKRPKVAGRYPASPCAVRVSGCLVPLQSTPTQSDGAEQDCCRSNSLRYSTNEEECAICCESVASSAAVRLCCGHGWYCRTCMARYIEADLETGAATAACPQCRSGIAEADLRKLVPSALVERLLAQSLEKAVCASADLKACLTPDCPMRVAVEPGEVPSLHCPLCKKSSCLVCGVQPYHRGKTCAAYQAGVHSKAAKGKKSRNSLQTWMEEVGAKQCPTCGMAVTKQDLARQTTQRAECHKMLCRCCSTKFCFKCLAVLSDTFTCGCTPNAHGFVDPDTGGYVQHLRRRGSTSHKKVLKKG
mmetsp:Transcript_8215/g.19307  ORF Transcript_8215/g.19307 Transcript_8215/m.19307 type:complete len:342 (-) Transcript_8215:55-1080(-)